MDKLIKIDEKGLVNARELHEFLENKRQFADWIKQRISQYGFIENEDFTVHKFVNGKATQIDYVITIDMAKELSMVENNEKGKAARKYFIQCEKKIKEVKQLSPMEQLRVQYQVLEQHEEKLNEVETKVNTLENNMTIDHGQACNIKLAVDLRVRKLCCGNESAAYQNKGIRSKVYRFIWKSIKDYFNVTAYHNLLRKDIDKVTNYINNLSLQGGLLREVQDNNNQMCFKQEA
jgi:anti-repressor protein